jgi:4,4'-diaponeurosporenoate glycosyltransferase
MGSQTIILTAALLLWSVGFLILGRLRRRVGEAPANNSPASFSIVIPARNEARNLPVLLRSIAEQPIRPLEVIVVDDASTDRTAEVAGHCGATVIASLALPEGWRGKTWACHQGANAARGDLLLFVDADTWFEKNGLPRILAAYQIGALSVGPFHAVGRPYEQLSAFFNLIMAAGTVPHGLFGQMLLVDRENYRRVGGHEAVKERILENFCLADQFRRAGIPVRSLMGQGVFAFRMYPNGFGELIEGWTKGFASGAARTPRWLLLLIVAWLTGMMLPVGSAPFSIWAVLLYMLFAAQLAVMFRQVGAFRWYAALLYPVPLVFYFVVFTWSMLRSGRQVTWKGRDIRAD